MQRDPSRASGRRRRRLGLAFLIAGAALALLFAVSAKWWFGYGTETWLADLGDGTLYTQTWEPNGWNRPVIGWCAGPNEEYGASGRTRSWTWTWWTWGKRKANWDEGRAFTVWPVAPLMILCGAALFWPGFREARRLRRNQCMHCGYSLAGLTHEELCPECGGQRPPAAP